jgi:alpha-L-fucosidase
LRGVGRWLAQNGAGIYNTRAGVIPPTRITASTRHGATHYVHVLDDESDSVILGGVPAHVAHARLVHTGQELSLAREGGNFFVSSESDRTTIYIPPELRDGCDTVLELR